jgi:hypothetical protein
MINSDRSIARICLGIGPKRFYPTTVNSQTTSDGFSGVLMFFFIDSKKDGRNEEKGTGIYIALFAI